MSTVHKSKIDTWLVAVVVLAVAVSLWASAVALLAGKPFTGWIVGLLVVGLGLPLWLFLGTDYRLASGQLHVRSGPFRWRVPLADITRITATNSPLSSPALSLDRLRIEYGQGKAIMVSPRDKDQFLTDIEAMRRVAG